MASLVMILQALAARSRINHGSNAVDPFYENVSALLHFNGPAGSTTFIDQVTNPWTAIGAAALATNQIKFGSASIYFNGTNAAIATPDVPSLELNALDFTIEGWINPQVIIGTHNIVSKVGSGNGAWTIFQNGARLSFYASSTGTSYDIASDLLLGTLVANTWQHFAVCRQSGVYRCFLNGIQGGTITKTTSIKDSTARLIIGADDTGGTDRFQGWLDDFRLTIGVSRYTSNFSPPTAQFADKGNFTPKHLFASSELGIWLDPSDFSTMFQNAAGTIAVTAAGQSVALIKDKSGNGLDATGSCILRQNVNGQFYLEFNGTSQSLNFGAINGGMLRHWAITERIHGTTDIQIILEQSDNYNNMNGAFLHYLASSSKMYYSQRALVSANTYNNQYDTDNISAISAVQFEFDRTKTTVAAQQSLWVNGILKTLTIDTTYPSAIVTTAFPNTNHRIAARAGNSYFATMDLYQLVGINRLLTPAERTNLKTFISQKGGL